jgi:hypothetical protein
MSYIVNELSFNIGGTNISQSYVKSLRSGIPWGINSSYIYKEDILREQFNSNTATNQHLVIENKTVHGNIIFKTQETGRIIINDLSVNSINGVPYSGIGSGSGIGGVSLTLNSVNSSHIQNGSILGIDICDGTITTSKIADNTITSEQLQGNCVTTSKIPNNTIIESQLQGNCVTETKILDGAVTQSKLSTALLDRIAELEKLQGIISIRNATSFAQGFSYTLSYKHPTTGVLTQFASYTNLNYTLTATHFFKLPSLTHVISIEVDSGAIGVSVEGASIIYGGTIEETDGNNILLSIDDVNVMVEIDVAI